jgi:hypothetical protein
VLSGFDKDEAYDLLDREDSFALRSYLLLDDRKVLYEQRTVQRYGEFQKVQSDLDARQAVHGEGE